MSEKRSTNELDKYLDDDIPAKSPEQPERERTKAQNLSIEDSGDVNQANAGKKEAQDVVKQVTEMIIKSSLTTLNIDGDNSSGEGSHGIMSLEEAVPGASLDEEEL